jgi:hypothetical protein
VRISRNHSRSDAFKNPRQLPSRVRSVRPSAVDACLTLRSTSHLLDLPRQRDPSGDTTHRHRTQNPYAATPLRWKPFGGTRSQNLGFDSNFYLRTQA